ncbi:hypothetical protein C8F01DRAFT_375217 [Mycena amicta]|nr:hypothetical protein C8F01DRAFT_375217 [Mycena amicta]
MSNSTVSPAAIAIQHQLDANYYFNAISFTLLFYDYFLTLPWEVLRYWGPTALTTAPNVLFFLNRYGTLLGSIPVVMQYFWTMEPTRRKLQVCESLHSYHQYLAVVAQIIIGVMLIIRTYALYERNRRILFLMVLVAAGVIGVGAWAVLSGNSKPAATDRDAAQLSLYIGCSSGVAASETTKLAIAWAGMAVFDCTIFLLTLYRALSRHVGQRGGELVGVLLRDGSVYFGVIVLCTVSNILTFIFAPPYTRGMPTTFTNVISSIMISRLMLNLRDPALASKSGRRGTRSGTSRQTQTLTTHAEGTSAGMFSTYLIDSPGDVELHTTRTGWSTADYTNPRTTHSYSHSHDDRADENANANRDYGYATAL